VEGRKGGRVGGEGKVGEKGEAPNWLSGYATAVGDSKLVNLVLLFGFLVFISV